MKHYNKKLAACQRPASVQIIKIYKTHKTKNMLQELGLNVVGIYKMQCSCIGN